MKIRKIIFIVLILQISSYFLVGDLMLEKQILNEFQEFSERRLLNKYNIENKNVTENFLFSSCGDEFFRDSDKLEEIITLSNPNRYEENKSINLNELSDYDLDHNYHPIFINYVDYYKNTLGIYYDLIKKGDKSNVIHFGACKINEIPLIFKEVELRESFSTHTDFHSMLYNDQMLKYKVNYIWILFKWVKINKELKKH